jgi:hypothetical protein
MLKKSSPLKLLGQMEPNLAGSIYVRSSIKLLCSYPRQPSVSSAQTDTYSLLCYYEYLLQNYRACRSWHVAHVCCLNLTSISYSFWNKKRKVLEEGHLMCLSYSDLSVWCYGCDQYVDNQVSYI